MEPCTKCGLTGRQVAEGARERSIEQQRVRDAISRRNAGTTSKPLTFGELKIGDFFIGFPEDGDDSGHGGYRRGSYLFEKVEERKPERRYMHGDNAIKVCDGVESHMPDGMKVVKVL